MNSESKVDAQTITDFGNQWNEFTENLGYYGSVDCLNDIFCGLCKPEELAGKRLMEIGSGSGRIVNMLLDAGAAHVAAVEPSTAFNVLRENTSERADQVELINEPGHKAIPSEPVDMVCSIGVLHHVVDPSPIVRAAYDALKPNGKMVIWLYGFEGNEMYLGTFGVLRTVSKRLPHPLLNGLCSSLNRVLDVYIAGSSVLPLPMHKYMRNHLAKLDRDQRHLTIYDQLNPAYAKYYRRQEAIDLLEKNGFSDVEIAHRHGYSWTVVGTKNV